MEEFIDTTPFCPGPIYFFDQLKPKVRRWKKETQKDPFLDPKAKEDHEIEPSTEPELRDDQENTALPAEEDKSLTPIISEPPSTPKSPSDSKFSKTYLYKTLFEEYKLIASEILYELEKTLKKYAQDGTAFPVGLLNLMTYSWQDLIEDSFKDEPPEKTLGRDRDAGAGSTSMTSFQFKEGKVNPDAKEHPQEESPLVKARKSSQEVLGKPSQKASLLSNTQASHQTTQVSSTPPVIHFSLTSKICFENGWIPCTKLEIMKLKADLSRAVKRLHTTTVQIKMEKAKQKRDGFNKLLLLRHYNDAEGEEEMEEFPQAPQVFWMELLVGKAQMPAMGEANPEMKKFHYALADGSSLT